MAWLYSEKAPFVLTLLFAILSWQIGEIVKEARAGKILIYSFEEDLPEDFAPYASFVALRIENPSRRETAGPFSFALICRDKPCLTGNARPVIEDPTAPGGARITLKTSDRALLSTTLPPGAVAWLVAETPGPIRAEKRLPRAIFSPEGEGEQSQRVIERGSLEARVVSNWLSLLTTGLALVLVLIATWMVFAGIALLNRRKQPEDAATATVVGNFELNEGLLDQKLKEIAGTIETRLTAFEAKLGEKP